VALVYSVGGFAVVLPTSADPAHSLYLNVLHRWPLERRITERYSRAKTHYQEFMIGRMNNNGLAVVFAVDAHLKSVDVLCLLKSLAGRLCHENLQFVGAGVVRNLRQRHSKRGVCFTQSRRSVRLGAIGQNVRLIGLRVRNS